MSKLTTDPNDPLEAVIAETLYFDHGDMHDAERARIAAQAVRAHLLSDEAVERAAGRLFDLLHGRQDSAEARIWNTAARSALTPPCEFEWANGSGRVGE